MFQAGLMRFSFIQSRSSMQSRSMRRMPPRPSSARSCGRRRPIRPFPIILSFLRSGRKGGAFQTSALMFQDLLRNPKGFFSRELRGGVQKAGLGSVRQRPFQP